MVSSNGGIEAISDGHRANRASYSAYSPDLDGCVATGKTQEEVEHHMQEAIAFHLEGMARGGEPVPEPHSYSAYVEVPAQAQ
jgi:predicted RNase H-like HicB family nuclease